MLNLDNMDDTYTFGIEKSKHNYVNDRHLRVYASINNNSYGLPLMTKEELKDLAKTIINNL